MSTATRRTLRLITPWAPSRTATARVTNPLPVPETCHLCGNHCSIVNNVEIYRREYGEWPWAVLCDGCGAYVGLHPFTGIPLGTLADGPMRAARKRAKEAFNPLWQSGAMLRSAAYAWLAGALGMPDASQCHIGWFDVNQCAAVVVAVNARFSTGDIA